MPDERNVREVSAPIGFPGRIIKVGEQDTAVVRQIQRRLNAMGCGPIDEDGEFDKEQTERAVKLLQARFADVTGRPLVTDGKVGSLTWGVLFGADTVPANQQPGSGLLQAVIAVARSQVGVLEQPLGSNRGPEVDRYLRAVGLEPTQGSFHWCVAFTYFCFQEAAKQLSIKNPHVRTAGVLKHWNLARNVPGAKRITHAAATGDPGLIVPGALFVMDFGEGAGHTGLVIEVANGRLVTIEGNTSPDGSRSGIGVFQRDARKVASINKGFIDYSGVPK